MIKGVLREDQWDLIVSVLDHIVARIDEAQTVDNERIHRLTRKVTKRRCIELLNDIKAFAPEAGK